VITLYDTHLELFCIAFFVSVQSTQSAPKSSTAAVGANSSKKEQLNPDAALTVRTKANATAVPFC